MATAERTEQPDHEYADYAFLFAELAACDPDDPHRTELRDKLVTAHMTLAEHIALRFRDRGVSQEDLRQVAMVGLVNAVDRFDPERGPDFLSFAVPTIMGEVRRHFRDSGWAMRVPRRLKELHLRTSKAITELSQQTGAAPTPSAIARYLGVSIEEVYEGIEAGQAYRPESLQEPLRTGSTGDDSGTLADTIGAADPEFDEVDNREVIAPLLAELPQRERTIVLLRFYRNLTQSEIAHRIGISQMHVSRLLAQTLSQLREQLAADREEPVEPEKS